MDNKPAHRFVVYFGYRSLTKIGFSDTRWSLRGFQTRATDNRTMGTSYCYSGLVSLISFLIIFLHSERILNRCEDNYVDFMYIAETWNSLSNIPFVVLALHGMITTLKERLPNSWVSVLVDWRNRDVDLPTRARYALNHAMIAFIGIGSFAFHATLMWHAQVRVYQVISRHVDSNALFCLGFARWATYDICIISSTLLCSSRGETELKQNTQDRVHGSSSFDYRDIPRLSLSDISSSLLCGFAASHNVPTGGAARSSPCRLETQERLYTFAQDRYGFNRRCVRNMEYG